MDERFIVKPTDLVVDEKGNLGYSYDYEIQYKDAENLNNLTKSALLNECKRRKVEAFDFPVPSKISRYELAKDLAMAKGYLENNLSGKSLKVEETQREF